MARDHRILQAILAVALALGALAPATAVAQVTFTVPRPVALGGERSGPDVFTAGGIAKECPQVHFNGTLQGNSKALELEPIYDVYGECAAKALSGLPARFAYRGCSYLFHPTGKIGGQERWTANVDIKCPRESGIQWYVYTSKTDFERGYGSCTTVMPSQRGLGTAELSNVSDSPGEIAIHWNLTGIQYKAVGSSLLCGPLFELRRDASYRGSVTIAAKDSRGRPVDLTVSG